MFHVLFADPNRDLLRCYAVLLADRGYAVTTVFDGAQVLEKLGSETFDAALLGDTLPRVGAEKLIPALHERHIPVLLLETDAKPTAADAVLPFPFLPQELYAAVRRLLPEESPKAGELE